jgi:hypothetical protein
MLYKKQKNLKMRRGYYLLRRRRKGDLSSYYPPNFFPFPLSYQRFEKGKVMVVNLPPFLPFLSLSKTYT